MQQKKISEKRDFFHQIQNTNLFDNFRDLMIQWNQQMTTQKTQQIYSKLAKYIKRNADKQIKILFKKSRTAKKLLSKKHKNNSKSQIVFQQNSILAIYNKFIYHYHLNKKNIQKSKIIEQDPLLNEKFLDQNFISNLKQNPTIIKFTDLYLKCIINLYQFKLFIFPLLPFDQFKKYAQIASDIQTCRRKGTLFAPINQLRQIVSAQRIGKSYINTPHYYNNKNNKHILLPKLREILNKDCMTVPLGSQHVSFNIMKKNLHEQMLFRSEDQKFEIDHARLMLKYALKQIEDILKYKIVHKQYPLLQQILINMYKSNFPYKSLKRNSNVALVIKPRIQQKLKELEKCRNNSMKSWYQVQQKNFHKGLDHRSFDFKKNDKKYNNIQKWDKELQVRTQFLKNSSKTYKQNINNRINFTVNSFQHIMKQDMFSKEIKINSNEYNCKFPKKFQQNVAFVMQFENIDIIKDIANILYQYINNKKILHNLLLKMFNVNIFKKENQTITNYNILNLWKILESKINNNKLYFDEIQEVTLMSKQQKPKLIDQLQEFQSLIQQQVRHLNIMQEKQSRFQGPDGGHILIGTKYHYYFIRYFLILYQRFSLAKKELDCGNQNSIIQQETSSNQERYELFLQVLTHKLKDDKFEDFLHKIYGKNAFLFVILEKIFYNLVKLINNFDELSNHLLKYDMKDYQLDIKNIQNYQPKAELCQIAKIYHQKNSVYFRFCYKDTIMYINSWSNIYVDYKSKSIDIINSKMQKYLTETTFINKSNNLQIYQNCDSQYITFPNHFVFRSVGQQFLKKKTKTKQNLLFQLQRINKIIFN